MKLYTIGFTKKSASTFFGLLRAHEVRLVLDIRLRPDSQLAGFARKRDLPYFLDTLVKAKYVHMLSLAPSEALFQSYRKSQISMESYQTALMDFIRKGDGLQACLHMVQQEGCVCLLCSESSHLDCHRSCIAKAVADLDASGMIRVEHL